MGRFRTTLVAALLALGAEALSGCPSPRTEIVLRIGTDLDQGAGQTLQAVTVQITTADNVRLPLQTFQLLGTTAHPDLPADLGIVPTGGDASRSVTVDVSALGAGQTVLFTYHVVAPFTRGQTTQLDVFLSARCLDASVRAMCSATQTCSASGCDDVVRTSLPPFSPDAGFDVNVPDQGTLDAVAESGAETGTDAPVDAPADVDTAVDPCPGGTLCNGQCSLLQIDVHHCGTCAIDCTQLPGVDQGRVACVAGACQIVCSARYADCDPLSPGCETDLHTPLNCGACGSACSGGTICNVAVPSWRCSTDCGAGATPCQGACSDISSDLSNCGACGNACAGMPNAAVTCTLGVCGVACLAGFHTCATDCVSDTSVSTCGSSCVSCAIRNGATASCAAGACTYVCLPGYQHCSTNIADGCESQQGSDAANCGACGNACPVSAPNCVAGICTSSCVAGGTCARPNPCTLGTDTCVGGSLTCSAAGMVAPGTACPGGVCDGTGTCTPCVAGVGCATANACEYGAQVCASGSPTCVHDSYRVGGSTCTVGGSAGVCDGNGTCDPCVVGAVCDTGNACTVGTTACSTGTAVCNVSGNQGSTVACGAGSGGTCDGAGHCNLCVPGSCSYVNPCFTGVVVCPGGSCGEGAPQAAGFACPGGVCDGSGACNACTAGAGCYLSDCERGQTVCASGHGVCTHAGFQPGGTLCNGGAGVCDGAGLCNACVVGAACSINGGCDTGLTVCASGSPVCVHSAYRPMGASCTASVGAGVCDGHGTCTACAASAPCAISDCNAGQIVCTSGLPVCMHTSNVSFGTACSMGTGICNGHGMCTPCHPGHPFGCP